MSGNQQPESHPITSEPVNGYQVSHFAAVKGLPTENARNGHAATTNGAGIAPQPVRPQIAPPPRPATSRLRSTVSLVTNPGQTMAAEDEAPVVVAPTRPDKPFDLEQLQTTWLAFAKLRQQQNDSATEQLVLNRQLTLNGTNIHITLDNTLQVGYLTEFKPELLGYLRDKLQNSKIQLEHTVTQQEVKKMIYSSQDKYNFMAEKNPALHELRKALNLEVDY